MQVVSCDPQFSFFEEADRYEAPGHNPALHRAFSLATKLHVRTLVRENISAEAWVREENDAISRGIGKRCTTRAWRLSFFRDPLGDGLPIEAVAARSYLGYLVVLRTQPKGSSPIAYIHDSVLESPLLLNNYVHCSREFACWLGDRQFSVRGSYFCQQNGVTGTCGHAALRTVLTDLSSPRKNPVTDQDINGILGLTPVPGETLALRDHHIVAVLQAHKLRPIAHDFFQDPIVDYPEFVHPFLESGCPVLLAFSLEDGDVGHILAVIGHTLNTDLWYPEARLGYPLTFPSGHYSGVPASYWVDNLIVQDDNYGMYTCLSSRCLSKITLPHRDPRSRVNYGFGILRSRVRRRPVDASFRALVALTEEVLGLWFPTGVRWLEELRSAISSKRRAPVLRTLLVSRRQYVEHARDLRDWHGGQLTPQQVALLQDGLPARFWMVEVSLPELYTANKRKLGELLFDITTPRPKDPLLGSWLGGRLPGIFYIPAPAKDEVPLPQPSSLQGHVDLYRGDWPRPDEW